jgi:hypothetical protein
MRTRFSYRGYTMGMNGGAILIVYFPIQRRMDGRSTMYCARIVPKYGTHFCSRIVNN